MEELEKLIKSIRNNEFDSKLKTYHTDDEKNCTNCNKNCVYALLARIEELKHICNPKEIDLTQIYFCIAHCCLNFEMIERGKYDNRITTKSE